MATGLVCRALEGVELKIVDSIGNALPPGATGEIVTRSSANMSGYFKMPGETAETIDSEGWLRTGDAGYLDAAGYLYLQDRVKDMIISGGENIYPAEVENAIFGHPAVAEVAVVGLPDERWGKIVAAFIRRRSDVAHDELDSHCRTSGLANFKRPRRYIFVREIPKSPVGKLLRRKLVVGEYEAEFKSEGLIHAFASDIP